MPARLARFAPLTGVVFVVLTLIAFLSGGETPNSNASPLKVFHYYTVHKSTVETTSVLFAFAFLFGVFWAGALAAYLRRMGASSGLTGLIIGGGVLMAVGAGILGGVEYGLAHNLHYFGAQTIQTLNVLANELFLPLVIGGCVFGIASGLAIVGGAGLPVWLGWVAIVIGIAAAIPPVGFISLLVFVLWSLVVSILIYVRSGREEGAHPVPAAAA
ncbi:MAG TPA: hypothetical protein VNV44_11980 [Solirubrobacteraceae bacterium]|nr:hypothetical protein [Solirubrobacteraceae bacterium]